ncbi:MAG TPA: hypothetical protein PLI41_07315 [Bacteroidales bacterium]|nr:hypothetical protein [Bacteroidales bacterium]HQB37338.1 hypothetical protein [Bacteroidales bacterium]
MSDPNEKKTIIIAGDILFFRMHSRIITGKKPGFQFNSNNIPERIVHYT